MKVLIVTLGSRGDVQPYVALGQGLKTAGHEVTICTSTLFQAFITDQGLHYGHMNNQLMQLMDSDAGRDAMENTNNLWGTIRTNIKLFSQVKSMYRQTLQDIWQTTQSVAPDLLILASKAAFMAEAIADKQEIPLVIALPFPQFVPTAQSPAMGFPDWPLGRWYNRLTYGIVHTAIGLYGGIPNEFRRKVLQLPPKPKGMDLLHRADGSPIPVLHGYSQHVVPRPTDWPDSAHVNGYWFLEQQDSWQPPDDLKAFLEAGTPPIYIGFGSISGSQPQRLAKVVMDALQTTHQRGILATGWGGLQTGDLPKTVFQLEQAPHDWLFPKVSAVIHHGGAGTTAAGLRAGRPTLICPFFGDQPFWGKQIYTLGVGPKPIPQKQLTTSQLAKAMHELVANQTMRHNAETLGEKIRAEDGVGNAIALLETLFSSQPLGHY
ncbi:glycosyl transferase, UDP-glucuronosyltransferase [Leptolyngbya sp. PCC 7375]|nr:glycosyl transferase, UDP-glucuronosyltransferase [Leptolyngbya sp. PCC 7375]